MIRCNINIKNEKLNHAYDLDPSFISLDIQQTQQTKEIEMKFQAKKSSPLSYMVAYFM